MQALKKAYASMDAGKSGKCCGYAKLMISVLAATLDTSAKSTALNSDSTCRDCRARMFST